MSQKKVIRPATKERKGFTYKSYNFTDKDPVIYEIWDIVKGVSFQYIEDESGVTASTLYNWFYGPTRKPQNATVRAVLRSVGYDYKIVKVSEQALPAQQHDVARPMQVLGKQLARNGGLRGVA